LKAIVAAPLPPASEPQRAKCAPDFAGMSMPSPATSQRSLKRRERQAFALYLDGDGCQQPGQPFFKRREALARGLRGGAILLLALFAANLRFVGHGSA
jgi:hypothetical protein